jgi:endonuclease/exonuclease/phosphatase family metal-dependent hydrolase
LKIITFNTLGIPLLSTNYNKRFDALVEKIIDVGPDVVCLQEVWAFYTKRKLIKALYDHGYRFSFYPNVLHRFNGLLTLSKYEIRDTKYQSLKPMFSGFNSTLLEFPGDKGYLLTRLVVGVEEVDVCNVHLNADLSGDYERDSISSRLKAASLRRLSSLIRESNGNKTIICGDFNFEPGSFSHGEFLQLAEVTDRVPLDYKTLTKKLFRFPAPLKGQRVDHIFTKNIEDVAFKGVSVIWDELIPDVGYLSDHAGLLIEIDMDQ